MRNNIIKEKQITFIIMHNNIKKERHASICATSSGLGPCSITTFHGHGDVSGRGLGQFSWAFK